MWLLDTARAELHFFSDPSAVPGGYAILSHTWNKKEDSFQDVQEIGHIWKREIPRDHVSMKIKEFCIVAEQDGYEWGWVDTCCINKESSTELAEAINSMFKWYLLSEVCYAYLEDVDEDDDHHAPESQFRRARWHRRGWTLQELLAPALVVFMSKDWKPIGTKHELCKAISRTTHIHNSLLTREKSLFKASIAERMAWAAERMTTRVEDEAYCLLGIFNINMPIIYGEGRRAFQRLQQELAKQYLDTTLFAWGMTHDLGHDGCTAVPLSMMWSGFHSPTHHERFLFASSPSDYMGSTTYYTPELGDASVLQPYRSCQWSSVNRNPVADENRREKGPFGDTKLPLFELTSYGMKCHFPVGEVDGITIAVLLVETDKQHLGLILHPAKDDELQDPPRKMYYTTWSFKKGKSYDQCRLAQLGDDLYNLRFRGKRINVTWRDIHIRALPPISDQRGDPGHFVLHFAPDRAPHRAGRRNPAPFRIPRWLVNSLFALDLLPRAGTVPEGERTGSAETWVEFTNYSTSEKIHLQLGLCTTDASGVRPHWAWADHRSLATWTEPWNGHGHDCETDHIDTWPGATKTFGDGERTIQLLFTPCVHSPRQTKVLHLALSGRVYERMQGDVHTSNHSRAVTFQGILQHRTGDDSPSQIGHEVVRHGVWTRNPPVANAESPAVGVLPCIQAALRWSGLGESAAQFVYGILTSVAVAIVAWLLRVLTSDTQRVVE